MKSRPHDKGHAGTGLRRGEYASLPLAETGDNDCKVSVELIDYAQADLEEHGKSWSDEEERRLVRRIDQRIMPCLFVMIILNYLDRNALANARVQGIEESLDMSGSEFNTAIAVFFVGYIGLQIPSNLILTKVKPSLYLPGCMIAWGLLSGSTAFVGDFRSLVVVRFLLGTVEAPFFPGALFLLTSWYTKREMALRMAILYTGSLLSGAFGGLLAAMLEVKLNDAFRLESWRWLFIIEASSTVLTAVFAMVTLPNYPKTTRFLTPNQRYIATARLETNSSQSHRVHSTLLGGLKQAALDGKVWLLALIILTKTSAAAVTSFIPTLVETFTSDRITTLLLSSPPYVFAAACTLAVSYSSDRAAERSFHIIVPMALGSLGFAVAGFTMQTAARYISLFLMLGGVYGSYNVALAWISATISEPPAKRSAALAIVNVTGNVAQIYSPYLYLAEFGPRYGLAMLANVGFCIACIGATLLLRGKLKRENSKLRLARRGDGQALGDDYML